jgi:glycosyltransferase involved in cell wall biosynthesis
VSTATLHVQLESELPRELAVGRGTAIFVCGWCFSPEAEIRSLSFLLDGEPQAVASHGMPRLDPFRAMHPELDPFEAAALSSDPSSPHDPQLRSYRSGFWGLVRIAAAKPSGSYELSLEAALDSGQTVAAPLGRMTVAERQDPIAAPWPEGADGPRVAIAMATYNPPQELLLRQLASIRAQTHTNWICVISDDCSTPERFAAIETAVAEEPRFVVSRSPGRLGFYHNFERALMLVPEGAEYVAMADQDDDWRPDKLAVLLARIGDAQLAYSDARVVSRDGEVISETWWNRRRNNHSDLLSLLVANAVTGAASLMPRELLDFALPFPPAQFAHFHDHWIGLTALALGRIEFVPEPLYDYVQHGDASLGHAAANQMTSLQDRIARRRELRERVHMWRLHYFVDIWRLRQFAAVLIMRCSERMSSGKRRVLERFIGADQSVVSLMGLAVRGARELTGTPETLGAEWALFHALAWRRLVSLTARARPQRRARLDAIPPASLVVEPGRSGLDEGAAEIASKIAPLRWRPADDEPARVNLLIPSIDLQHFFGGYIAKFNLARRLAERGLRVRVVTVDPVGALPGDWRDRIESFAGLGGLLDQLEIVFGRESPGLECSRDDSFIATTWWTAYVAHHALEQVEGGRFLYLIQEYEPFTFPMGTYAALAGESYLLPHYALFSSELLRGYFRRHGIGVYAAGADAGDRESIAFQNAITQVAPPTEPELASRARRRLLFYARPEPHAARNMFELGVLALARALEQGAFESDWELNGIGTVQGGGRIALGSGRMLTMLPRTDQRSYAEVLRDHDVGLALMYTPHPSLVPIEMASAGMLTVTNSFENKTAEALSAISANLVAAEPTIDGIAAALDAAGKGVTDLGRRLRGSKVSWSSRWDESLHDELLDWIVAALGIDRGSR